MLQSLYTTTVVNQLVDERMQNPSRSQRRSRRRLFGRGGRDAAPRSAPHGRLRVSGAGR
jgi:hypothetical protein